MGDGTAELSIPESKHAVSIDGIIIEVAEDFKIPVRLIKSPGKGNTSLNLARDEVCRRLRNVGLSYGEIAAILGGRTRQAVMAATKRARKRVI